MATVTTYDFKNTSVIIDGFIVTGYADGDAISVEYRGDGVALTVGAAGDGEYSQSNDNSAEVTLSLQRTSLAQDYIETLYHDKKEFALTIIDKNDNSRTRASEQCRVQKVADITSGAEASPREFIIIAPDLQRI